MADLNPLKLSFRAYLRQRSKRYTPESIFLTALVHDDDFAAPNSRDELDEYLALGKLDRTEGYSLTPYGIAT